MSVAEVAVGVAAEGDGVEAGTGLAVVAVDGVLVVAAGGLGDPVAGVPATAAGAAGLTSSVGATNFSFAPASGSGTELVCDSAGLASATAGF